MPETSSKEPRYLKALMMTGQREDEINRFGERINDIEVKLEYLQRDYETQNEMILVDAQRILKLEATVARLAETVELHASGTEIPRKPEDEKPPHY